MRSINCVFCFSCYHPPLLLISSGNCIRKQNEFDLSFQLTPQLIFPFIIGDRAFIKGEKMDGHMFTLITEVQAKTKVPKNRGY